MVSKNWARGSTGASSKEDWDARVSLYDGYNSPKIAIKTLLEREDLADWVWEPSSGLFKIVNPLRKAGCKVYTSDICDWHDEIEEIEDFANYKLPPKKLRGKLFDICTNPPFKHAHMFVEQAMKLLPEGGRLYLLLRLQFLEGNKRHHLFKKYPPRKVWVYSYRLPRMHRFFHKGKSSTSLLCFAWFVFERGYKGPTKIDWIGR